jgi:NAD(P)-dependent dehydrogenase (short-subunit alcohol dehydrogenase family)
VAAGGGSIFAIGSTVAVHGQRRIPAAVTAKLAVTGLMRSIAVDYGPDRIRANTLVLGLVPHDEYTAITQGPIGEAFLRAGSLPFFGEPRDVAAAAVYLASDESRWVTGTELVVSGGISRAPDVLELLSAHLEGLEPSA